MHPILLDLGFFKLPAYGASLVFAFLTANFFLKREAVKLDLDPKRTADVAIIALLFGLVGAKVLLILVDLPEYLADPKLIIASIRSAGVIYGGLVVGAVGVIWYLRRHKLPFWTTLDCMAPFAALGVGLGRIGCLMAGCCYGVPHEGHFSLVFPDHPYCDAPPGVELFPIQIVSLINGVMLCIFLVWLLRNRRFPGEVLASYAFLYSLTRGLIEIFRGDTVRGVWLDGLLSTSQIIAIVIAIFSVLLYLNRMRAAEAQS